MSKRKWLLRDPVFLEAVRVFLNKGFLQIEIARKLEVSRQTISNAKRELAKREEL